MIIIKIKGGLGNQLFQYALGRSVEIKTGKKVKFDLSWYKQFPQRKYRLDKFNTRVDVANFFEIIQLRKFEKKDGRRYLPFNLISKNRAIHIKENDFGFKAELLNIKQDTYLDGNWQSYKYFDAIEEILSKEIALEEKTGEDFNKILKKINNSNSVSLHIRRGDYTTKKVQQVLKLCAPEYYRKAVDLTQTKVINPTFFIFSDDIEWAKKNLKIDFPMIFVSNGNFKDYEELILISKCKHNIIVNSSFSWWGAWLNNNPNKIVTAPKNWFRDKTMNIKDLTPNSWIKI